jgi:tRNA A37 threonylcarbamoyladenosine synthetase subunit TsaC/SUA5/YrdC
MGAPDIKADARRAFEVLKAGGIAIIPAKMGYAIASSSTAALEKVFTTKRRGAHKRHAMGGSYELHKELHVLDPQHAEIVRCLVQDFDLPLAVIAKYNPDHPMMKNIDQSTLEALTVDGTLAMLINGGALQDELTKLMMEANLPLLGSSANLSGTGMTLSHLVFSTSALLKANT